MYTKQITNGRALPNKIWHLPSLTKELYYGSEDRRRLYIDSTHRTIPAKYGEVSRTECELRLASEYDEAIAWCVEVVKENGKKHWEITKWLIKPNATYIFEKVKSLYPAESSRKLFDKLVLEWDIPNASFEQDIVASIKKDEAMIQSYLVTIQASVLPLLNEEYEDEIEFNKIVKQTLSDHKLEGEFFEDQVWDTYGLDADGNFVKGVKTFSSIFLGKELEIHHKRINNSTNKDISPLHWTRWGAMSESENDWED